jgi:Primase C terminal 1 (PriCT-1)/Bifunctional DNA primase/polymerase, N-terminal
VNTHPPQAEAIARKFTSLGGHLNFFPRGTKACKENGWQERATNDFGEALKWIAEVGPDANVGLVGKENGLWALDDDSALLDEFIQTHGPINTYTTQTVSGGKHYIFRQNAASWTMGNISIKDENGAELVSARINDRYVVLAGSWAYPHNDQTQPLTQYKAVDSKASIVEAPESLLRFIKNKDAEWKAKIAAAKSSKQTTATKTQVHEGGRNNYLAGKAGTMRNAGVSRDSIFTELLRINERDCVPPLNEAEVTSIADSYGKYSEGTGRQIIVSQPNTEAGDDEPEENFTDAQDPFPECPIFPGALTELARALFPSLPLEFKQWGIISRWGLMRSGIDTFGMEKHIQPRFYSVLVSPPNIGKTACINETRTAMEVVQRIIGDLIGTSTKARVCTTPESVSSVDSGQYFSLLLDRLVKEAKAAHDKFRCTDLGGKAMLDPDELSDIFEKGRSTPGRASTMFIELLKLHSANRTGSGTKRDGKLSGEGAHLAILAGTTVRKYPMLWTGTGGGADGLVSRFIPITTNNPPVPPVPLPSDSAKAEELYQRLAGLAQLPGQNVVLDDEAAKMLTHWWSSIDNTKESATRVLEVVKQLLIVLAVTNLTTNHEGNTVTVDSDLMSFATQFGDYIIAVRERLNPNDSWTFVQAMENAITSWAKKHTSKAEPKTMNDCRRGIQPQRLPGGLGVFKQAWGNCVGTGVLKFRDKGHKGGGKYSV